VITSEAGVIAGFGYFVHIFFPLVAVAGFNRAAGRPEVTAPVHGRIGRDAHASIAAW
jgi:hypothetical protein